MSGRSAASVKVILFAPGALMDVNQQYPHDSEQPRLRATLDDSILSRVPDRFSDDDGKWVGTSGRSRVVVYDSADVDAGDLPQSIEDIVDPRWSGRMAVAPTNTTR